MKINEFVIAMKDGNTPLSELIAAKRYISSADKLSVAKATIDASAEYDRGFVTFDSYKKHIAFLCNVIEAHTDLKFADKFIDRVQEYDLLCENELLDAIVDTFRKDYEASMMVLDMSCSDMFYENSMEASMAKLTQSVSENLDVFVGVLVDKIEGFDVEKIIPKNLDLDKVIGLLNKFK